MREITIGAHVYRIVAAERDDRWVAHAERVVDGRPFGATCAGETEGSACDRLLAWLGWQHEHAVALEALQQAQRAFHRTVAGSAFADPMEGPTAIELHKEALDHVEAARVRLDEVRAREPRPEA
jgi:hypothetical protein